jgi:cyanophycinase
MAGYILLEGGAEFGGKMAEPDRRAIELAGGPDAPISIIPAAAAPDYNHERAGNNGRRWFNNLGARNVSVVPLLDRASADRPNVVEALRRSRLIYLLGGFPHFLGQSLSGSRSWEAILEAFQGGAVVAGSSAGAMVLCEFYDNPENDQVVLGLGLVANACVLPHHNGFGKRWAPRLSALLPRAVLIGIDERTGMINDREGGGWRVYGSGAVTLYRQGGVAAYRQGSDFLLI